MTCVLGYPLARAVALLQAEGLTVQCVETRSRKGLETGADRVVRQQTQENGDVLLTYARFQTETATI